MGQLLAGTNVGTQMNAQKAGNLPPNLSLINPSGIGDLSNIANGAANDGAVFAKQAAMAQNAGLMNRAIQAADNSARQLNQDQLNAQVHQMLLQHAMQLQAASQIYPENSLRPSYDIPHPSSDQIYLEKPSLASLGSTLGLK